MIHITRTKQKLSFLGMMCPPLPEPVNGEYMKTSKKISRKLSRSGSVGILEGRWGSQYRKCPLGVEIPKSKVNCTLRCKPGFVIAGTNVRILFSIITYGPLSYAA